GIETVWPSRTVSRRDTHEDDGTLRDRQGVVAVRVIILRGARGEFTDAGPNVLGLATGNERQAGTVVYIFYDRVSHLSARYEERGGRLLGHVIAHEVGHLLLPYGAHSRSGLMHADWTRDDMEHIAHGLLLFAPRDAQLLRHSFAIQ